MRRGRIEIKVVLLDVFAVIAFIASEPEQPFLQNWVFAVPHRQGKAHQLAPVGNPQDSVFAPAVGSRTCVIVREEIPRCSVFAVVFADGAPLPFGEIRPPALPVRLSASRFFKTFFFGVHSYSPFFECLIGINLRSKAASSFVSLQAFSSHSRAG